MKREKQYEELELTESDLEYGRTAFKRLASQRSPRSDGEVAAMRERIERDKEALERFEESRLRRLSKQKH